MTQQWFPTCPRRWVRTQLGYWVWLFSGDNPTLRQRLRGGFNLLIHYDSKLKKQTNFAVQKTMTNVKANVEALAPVCRLIYLKGRFPDIESLEHQVQQVFSFYNVNVHPKTIGDQAWAIRHLITVLKQSVRPPKPGSSSGFERCPKDSLKSLKELLLIWFALFSSNQTEVFF